MKKIIFSAIAILLILCFVFISVISLPWLYIAVGILLSPSPPRPSVIYGEFHFLLEYELNGKVRVIDDTLVCKFDGFDMDEGRGKTRRWRDYFKNEQNNELYAYRIEDPNYNGYNYRKPSYDEIVLQNIDHYKIVFSVESAEYFLGDPNYIGASAMPYIQVYDVSTGYYKDPDQSKDFLDAYGFKILRWYCDPPIQNSFK